MQLQLKAFSGLETLRRDLRRQQPKAKDEERCPPQLGQRIEQQNTRRAVTSPRITNITPKQIDLD